jgi:ferredoxin
LRANTGLSAEPHERLIRPPAALDEKPFLARCIRCGECMKVCPNNALHPALTEAGWEGIWTPVLVPRVGYCEPSCTLCGQVCPTGAIWEFTSKEKAWIGVPNGTDTRPIRLGTAFYDRGRCLPWAMATDCIVCEEWCPTSPKAVYLRSAEVADAAGNTKQVRQPYIDPARCVGCGACEFACPVRTVRRFMSPARARAGRRPTKSSWASGQSYVLVAGERRRAGMDEGGRNAFL